MTGIVSYLATLGKIGGPIMALVGIIAWYQNRRAEEDHEAEQSQIDRLYDRVSELEEKQGVLRKKLDEQHEKIVKQGRTIANLHEEIAEAERVKAAKDGQIMKLENKVDILQQKVARLEERSEPIVEETA